VESASRRDAISPRLIEPASDFAPCAISKPLLHQRQHALTEICQVRELALAPEQVATKLFLKLLDGAVSDGCATCIPPRRRVNSAHAPQPGSSGSDAFPWYSPYIY